MPFFTPDPNSEDCKDCKLRYNIHEEDIAYFEDLGRWYRAFNKHRASQPSKTSKKFKRRKTITEAVPDEFFIVDLEVSMGLRYLIYALLSHLFGGLVDP